MTLKTPLRIVEGHSASIPAIVEADGKPLVSFGNLRKRGLDWCREAANQIVHSVNGSVYTQLVTENRELRAEVERLKTKCNGLIDALGEADWASYYPQLTGKE